MRATAKLVEVSCRKCGKALTAVVSGALVYCHDCRTWNKAEGVPQYKTAKPKRRKWSKGR